LARPALDAQQLNPHYLTVHPVPPLRGLSAASGMLYFVACCTAMMFHDQFWEDPLRCEPGMETATDEKVELANVFVVHECIRVGASISDRVGAACLKLLNTFELRQCLEFFKTCERKTWTHLCSHVLLKVLLAIQVCRVQPQQMVSDSWHAGERAILGWRKDLRFSRCPGLEGRLCVCEIHYGWNCQWWYKWSCLDRLVDSLAVIPAHCLAKNEQNLL